MKYAAIFVALALAILTIDWAVSTLQERHQARRREREMARFNIVAFRGAKKSAWHL